MHYPVEIVLGPAHIPAHLIFEILAYSLGFRAYQWARKRVQDPISTENRWWIFLGAVAGAFFGAHLLGVLERPLPQSGNFIIYFMANKTVLGGFLGGLIGVEWTKKIIGVTHSSGDLMAYPMILALVIGRIGCHLAGLNDGTHGLPATLPWAIDFGDGMPRHPVNLYEIAFLCLLGLFIFVLENGGLKRSNTSRLADGGRFKLFMIGYLCWRFAAEWLKPVWYFSLGFTSIQMAAAAGLVYYAWLYFWKKETIFHER
jgi:phosphatidylglycerol:prolipoprotein diacylglycerol transferase